jgi:hypothetical protein
MLISTHTRALVLSFLLTSCAFVFAQDQADNAQQSDLSTIGDGSLRPAPAWQKIGNTGLPTQNWWIQFDRAGYMYVSSNNPPAGGVAKSTDKGFHWKTVNTGFTCHLHRGMGLAPDGTVWVGNDYCTVYSQGNNHFYWLDNVKGSGTVWTAVTVPKGVGNGATINESVIANDGKTIVATSYSGIWLSTDNARSWFLSPGSPYQGVGGVAEGMDTHKQPDGTIYAGFAHGGVYYSKDNGYHFSRLGYPPPNPGNTNGNGGDIWAMTTAPAGPVAGYLMIGAGNSGNNAAGTGIWCYGPQAPPNGHWVFCGNNAFAGESRFQDFTRIVVNPSKTRVIAIIYGDRGQSVVYSDDGMNWNACNSGLPRDASTTAGGANTQGMNVDPATGYYYIVLKNGDIYRTTQPQ